MYKTYILIILCFLFFSVSINAQQVLSTSGGFYENGGISLSWTVGEPLIETIGNETITLTQGFQQPYDFYLKQIIQVPAGWSGISSYLSPTDPDVENIFYPYYDDLIIVASMNEVYYPTQSINTILTWNNQTGYKIKAQNDFNLVIRGDESDNRMVELAAGWNLLPVISECDADISVVFGAFTATQIIKEVAGPNVYWPEYGINTIGNLHPGKSYYAAMETSTLIEFPACTKEAMLNPRIQKLSNTSPWPMPHPTASSHIIAIPSSVLLESKIFPGDFIGVFTPEGLCAGYVEISSVDKNLSITAFAKDELTGQKDGFESGDPFQFKIYENATGNEVLLDVDYESTLPNSGFYVAHGISAMRQLKRVGADSRGSSNAVLSLFPNPTNGEVNIYMTRWPQNPEIHISDPHGSIIKMMKPANISNNSSLSIDLSTMPQGVYFFTVLGNDFLEVRKVVLQ